MVNTQARFNVETAQLQTDSTNNSTISSYCYLHLYFGFWLGGLTDNNFLLGKIYLNLNS